MRDRMNSKTWQDHRTEMQQEYHREWLQVVAISMVVIAAATSLVMMESGS